MKKQKLLNDIGILFLGEAEFKNFGDYYDDVPISNNDGNVVTIGDVYEFIQSVMQRAAESAVRRTIEAAERQARDEISLIDVINNVHEIDPAPIVAAAVSEAMKEKRK